MIRFIVVSLFFMLTHQMESQNWDSIRGGLSNDQIESLIFDSINNELIVSGKFINKIGGLSTRGIARWNGIGWDSLAGGINTHSRLTNPNFPGGMVLCGVPYNGKMLFGGNFKSIGGMNATSLALWDGTKWDSLPKRAFDSNSTPPTVTGLFKKGNLIYIHGSFTTINGLACKGLAIWNGVNFVPIPLSFNSFISVSDIKEFQNEIYISGGYFYNPPYYLNNSDVLKFDGTNWVSMIPGGVKGAYAGIASMTVYNNELYVGGHFLIADGNAGENIMKWNGTQWLDVGFGGESVGQVRKLIVSNGKLWAFGCFYKAAYMSAFSVAVFDGSKWCALQDTLDNCILTAEKYKDTIYVGGGFMSASGDTNVKYIAKLKNQNNYKSCNGVGLPEYQFKNSLTVIPNPASTTLHIKTDQYFDEATKIEITNSLRQVVMNINYSAEIDVSTLENGCYFLKIETSDRKQYFSKFVKHE